MTEAQRKKLAQQRSREEAATEAMLEAMRCLGFEAVCQTFAGHVLGRPDVRPTQVHDELQRLARCAWAEIPAGEV